MINFNIENISDFTNLSKDICLSILELIESEFGEIGNFIIEDNEVSFNVYRGYWENATKIINFENYILRLIDKFDDPYFSLSYVFQDNSKKL